MSEGAAYGVDQSQEVYSPYSPFSPESDKSLYKTVDNTAAYKTIVANSKERLGNYPAYIERKAWLEVKNESTRYLYNLRKAMNGLAVSKDAVAAKKAVFADLEALTYAATVKDQDKANAAYNALVTDFAAFEKTI